MVYDEIALSSKYWAYIFKEFKIADQEVAIMFIIIIKIIYRNHKTMSFTQDYHLSNFIAT